MGLVESALALIGLVAVIGAITRWHMQRSPDRPAEADIAAPYREGLRAAIRIRQVAQDLEQQIYAEAARHMESESSGNQGREES